MATTASREWTTKEIADKVGVSTQRVGKLLKELNLRHRYLHSRMILVPSESVNAIERYVGDNRKAREAGGDDEK